MRLAAVALVVPDYDEAIAYFTKVLGFQLVEDTPLSPEKRWVVVSPGEGGSNILLAKAASETQRAAIGKHAGGRVGFFLHVEDFDTEFERMVAAGVNFVEAPRAEKYGQVVVFDDLYGNRWDLIQAR